jgi:hypothetical protein
LPPVTALELPPDAPPVVEPALALLELLGLLLWPAIPPTAELPAWLLEELPPEVTTEPA